MGLEINKKQIFWLSRKDYNGNEYVQLYTYKFEIVIDYTYLGKILINESELKLEIEKRIINANRTY